MRDSFVKSLIEIARIDSRVVVLTPDLGYSVLDDFQTKYPDRFINVGIAEANAVSIASGLALSGKIIYIYSIIPFITMRPFEQIRLDIAYMNTNVRLVGVGAGVTYGQAGPTHHAIEDIAIMRSLPNMTVFCPGDPWEVEQGILQSLDHKGPIYFRLGKRGEPRIARESLDFSFGKASKIRSGHHVSIITTSNTLDLAQLISQDLLLSNISVDLTNMHTIKPLDTGYLLTLIKRNIPIYIIEEHSIIGGLSSAIAEFVLELPSHPAIRRFALKDEYIKSVGSQNYIREQQGMTRKNIVGQILSDINKESASL